MSEGGGCAAAVAGEDTEDLLAMVKGLSVYESKIKSRTATKKDIAEAKALKGRLEAIAVRISTTPPAWGSLPILAADVFVSDIDARLTGPDDLERELPLVPSTEGVRCQIADSPFAKGAVRYAYRARVEVGGAWRPYIVKQFIDVRERSSANYTAQVEADNFAHYLAEQWMEQPKFPRGPRHTGQAIAFLESRLLKVTMSDGHVELYTMEEAVTGEWDKYSNNDGSYIDYKHPEVLRFSEWTYKYSNGYLMVTDLQGGFSRAGGYSLTDPAILCRKVGRFGPTDFNPAQMKACRDAVQHGLKPGARPTPGTAPSSSTLRRGSAMRPTWKPYEAPRRTATGGDRVLYVTGAGHSRVNGSYRQEGIRNGKPFYKNTRDPCVGIKWSGGSWMIIEYNDPSCRTGGGYYQKRGSSSDEAPEGVWGDGMISGAPAPTVEWRGGGGGSGGWEEASSGWRPGEEPRDPFMMALTSGESMLSIIRKMPTEEKDEMLRRMR